MAIILWILVFFFLGSLFLIFLSIKSYLGFQVKIQKSALAEKEREFGQSETETLRKEIISLNLNLKELKSFYQKKVGLAKILEKISQNLPQEAYLTNLSIVLSFPKEKKEESASAEEKPYFQVSLSGFISTREKLFDLKKNLEKEEIFRAIYFPPANWVKPGDINFFLTFEIPLEQI